MFASVFHRSFLLKESFYSACVLCTNLHTVDEFGPRFWFNVLSLHRYQIKTKTQVYVCSQLWKCHANRSHTPHTKGINCQLTNVTMSTSTDISKPPILHGYQLTSNVLFLKIHHKFTPSYFYRKYFVEGETMWLNPYPVATGCAGRSNANIWYNIDEEMNGQLTLTTGHGDNDTENKLLYSIQLVFAIWSLLYSNVCVLLHTDLPFGDLEQHDYRLIHTGFLL